MSTITGDKMGVSHSADGIWNARSTIRVSNQRSVRNSGMGVLTNNNADTVLDDAIIANNGSVGINTQFNAQTRGDRVRLRSNTTNHALTDIGSTLELRTPDANEIGTEYYAANGSYQIITGPVGAATVSPASGTPGNNAALTTVN